MKFRLLVLLCSFACCFKSFSQNHIYLKIDGINGDVVVKGHEKEFEILAFELVGQNSASTQVGGGGGAGKVSFSDAKIKKFLTPNTNPDLMLLVSNGKHVRDVTIMWVKSGEASSKPFYQVKLTEVIISSMSVLSPECSGSDCNNLFEEIHFNYGKIEWSGSVQNPNGSQGPTITKSWNIAENVPG